MRKKKQHSKTAKIDRAEYWDWVQAKAKEMRKSPTDAEMKVKEWLGIHKVHYFFQKPILCAGKNKAFIADFVLGDKHILEVDGPTHKGQEKADEKRTRRLFREGYDVHRITNSDAYTPAVLDKKMTAAMIYWNIPFDENPQAKYCAEYPINSKKAINGNYVGYISIPIQQTNPKTNINLE